MARKQNTFEKQRREMEKRRKAEEKRARRQDRKSSDDSAARVERVGDDQPDAAAPE